MRLVLMMVLAGLVCVVGCASDKRAEGPPPGRPAQGTADAARAGNYSGNQDGRMIVTPSGATKGKVAFVNANARYVVLSFPLGTVPTLESRFNVYREGLKVGEVKVTGPTMDNNTIGDITVGDVRSGDEVRNN